MTPRWFDAHLDLACIAALGRDMAAPVEQATGPWPPASVTLDSLRKGNVQGVLGTIFTEAGGTDAGVSYTLGDAAGAREAGLAQLHTYEKWAAQGHIALKTPLTPSMSHRLTVSLLMECADPITDPSDLAFWVSKGVVAIGMAWARGSRYAAGNSIDPALDTGLSPLGRDLVREMDRQGVVHDASHLSDRALAELFDLTDRPIIASHSNCRSIIASAAVEGDAIPESLRSQASAPDIVLQRHLTDDTIREIARRGGVIGLNLYSPFLIPGALRSRRATIAEAIAHVDHICALVGHTRAVGLGSDMDGGFSGATLPEGIATPGDLHLLLDALCSLGWNEEDLERFASRNWTEFFHT